MATTETEFHTADEEGATELGTIDTGVALTAADRAQIDIQIATAKKYPRAIDRSVKEAIVLVCTDEDVATSMTYALPRKQEGRNVFIEGPSVRLAETIVYCWGNMRAEARIIGIDETHVIAQGTCMDLEKNIGIRYEVRRRITDKKGKKFNDDMIVVTGNAACAIAFRNAVFKVVPAALVKKVWDAAKKFATGGAQPIEARRAKALQWFARVGAHEARVLELLSLGAVDEITEEHLSTLFSLKTAIQDGSTTVEEAFSNGSNSGDRQASEETTALNDAINKKKGGKAKEPTPAEPAKTEPPKATQSDQDKALGRARQLLVNELGKHGHEPDSPEVSSWLKYLLSKNSIADLTTADITKAVKALESGDLPRVKAPGSAPKMFEED